MQSTAIMLLKRGDVFMVSDASSTFNHFAIAFGQAMMTRNSDSSKITHVGMYDGAGNIIEASGQAGLRIVPLSSKIGLKYKAMRLTAKEYEDTGELAADIAYQLCERRAEEFPPPADEGFGRNTKPGSISSIFRLSYMSTKAQQRLLEISKDPTFDRGFYCSRFDYRSFQSCLSL